MLTFWRAMKDISYSKTNQEIKNAVIISGPIKSIAIL
jgi:hypothetical protein